MKKIKWIIISLAFVVVTIFCIAFVFLTNEDILPELPIKSEQNTIAVTCNGCCLWGENVTVSIIDGNGSKTTICKSEKVYGFDIFYHNIPDIAYAPIQLLIEINLYYGEYYKFSEQVLYFEDISELRKTGVLIYIQEADYRIS